MTKEWNAHGQSGTPLYHAWEAMRQRTTNRERYPHYADVNCDPLWESFPGFLNNQPTTGRTYEPGLCLSRIGDSGDYAPENTRWLTRVENRAEQVMPTLERCKRGHEFTPENTIKQAKGNKCRACTNQRNRDWRRRVRDRGAR